MVRYTFYDRDYFTGRGEFCIVSEHLDALLDSCFRYGKYISVASIYPDAPVFVELKPWFTEACQSFALENPPGYVWRDYQANENTRKIVSKYLTNLFVERLLPNQCEIADLSVWRVDGSCFFDTIIEEGECSLYPREGEDVSDVLAFGRWLPINEDGWAEIPAKEATLPEVEFDEMQADALYRKLREIKENGEIKTIEALCNYLDSYRPFDFWDVEPDILKYFNFLPRWFVGFEYFLLAKCNALTTTKILDALTRVCHTDGAGFDRFFEILNEYTQMVKTKSDNK